MKSSAALVVVAHNGLMRGVEKNGQLNLAWGILGIGAIFVASASVAMWLLVVMGSNPLSRGIYFYAGIAIVFMVGAKSVVEIFRWQEGRVDTGFRVNAL